MFAKACSIGASGMSMATGSFHPSVWDGTPLSAPFFGGAIYSLSLPHDAAPSARVHGLSFGSGIPLSDGATPQGPFLSGTGRSA